MTRGAFLHIKIDATPGPAERQGGGPTFELGVSAPRTPNGGRVRAADTRPSSGAPATRLLVATVVFRDFEWDDEKAHALISCRSM